MRPGLTVVVMVKDDAERLRRCLESARGVADEMIVLDTGSTDGSVEVAREAGAQVLEMEWPGAFDVALNTLLDKVETVWTLRLDSDEWLLPETHGAIREVIKDETAFLVFLLGHDVMPEGAYTEQHRPRLWRTHPALRVRGAIHEQFPPEALAQAAEGRVFKWTQILFMHDGYMNVDPVKKGRRNAELIKKELQIRPGQIYFEVALADELCALGDPAGPLKFKKLAATAIQEQGAEFRNINMIIAFKYCLDTMTDKEIMSERADDILKTMLEWFSDFPMALWSAANAQLRRNNLPAVYTILKHLEELAENGAYRRELPIAAGNVTEALWRTLAPLARKLGDLETSRRNYQRLAEAHPEDASAAQALRSLSV